MKLWIVICPRPSLVVTGFDEPVAILHRHQPGALVAGDHLETGPAARLTWLPPPFTARPGACPGDDTQRRSCPGGEPRRDSRHAGTAGDRHRLPRRIGDPGRERGRIEIGRA